MAKLSPKSTYSVGEVFENPYLETRITEILDTEKKRAGWIWTHSDGRIVISPHLGFYIWEGPGGEPWTAETGALWLVQHRT